MDALRLLEQDHHDVKRLLQRLTATTQADSEERQRLFAQIARELTAHEAIEEEIFYPELRSSSEDAEDEVLEAYEEHHVVDEILGEMQDLPVEDEEWLAKATVMRENIEHHVMEEERDLFALARTAFTPADLDEIGEEMEERKQEVLAGFDRGQVPAPDDEEVLGEDEEAEVGAVDQADIETDADFDDAQPADEPAEAEPKRRS